MESVITVGALARQVSNLLGEYFSRVWVKGEISNFTRAASGHWYFTIKDDQAAVKAVMFRGRASLVPFTPVVGEKVELLASASLYEPRGDFQLQVESMRRAGMGNLHEAFLQRKQKLQDGGLFDPERKKPIPTMPRKLGVITSLGAAALRDVLTAAARRLPHVEVIVYPALVQGDAAAESLCHALQTAVTRNEVDTLLLVRGGGSLEDLWCFNDEALARLIAAAPIPIISGVGHETDFTIADFVADLRAPTPTAAAELAGHSQTQCLQQLQALLRAMDHRQGRIVERAWLRLDRARAGLVSPEQKLRQQQQRLESLQHRLQQRQQTRLESERWRVTKLSRQLQQASPQVEWQRRMLSTLEARLLQHMPAELRRQQQRVTALQQTLQALSPIHVLERGYAIVRNEAGQIVKNALDLSTKEQIDIQLAQGSLQAEVKQTRVLF